MSFLGELWDNTAGGLLWKPLKKATGLTDAQMIGIGAMAVGAPYALPAMGAMGGAAGASGAAGAAAGSGGLLSSLGQIAGPASQAMNIAGQANALSEGRQMQAPQMQPVQSNPGAFTGLLGPTDQFDPQKRRQAQEMAMQGLLGGYRG